MPFQSPVTLRRVSSSSTMPASHMSSITALETHKYPLFVGNRRAGKASEVR